MAPAFKVPIWPSRPMSLAGVSVTARMIVLKSSPRARYLEMTSGRFFANGGILNLSTVRSVEITSGRNPAARARFAAFRPKFPFPLAASKITPRSLAFNTSGSMVPSSATIGFPAPWKQWQKISPGRRQSASSPAVTGELVV